MGHSSEAVVGKDSPDDHYNIPGRLAYLKALNRLWREALQELRDEVAPKFAHLWKDMPDRTPNIIYSERTKRVISIENEMHSPSSMLTLRRWARGFQIRDKWILDAAAEAILWHYDTGNVRGRWFWLSPDSTNLEFSLTISETRHLSESWERFQKRIRALVNRQLAQYRIECNKRSGTFKTQVDRDAEWTVRYQKGERAKDIAAELFRGYEEPAQTVYRAVERFARDIGLTLPNRRRRTPE